MKTFGTIKNPLKIPLEPFVTTVSQGDCPGSRLKANCWLERRKPILFQLVQIPEKIVTDLTNPYSNLLDDRQYPPFVSQEGGMDLGTVDFGFIARFDVEIVVMGHNNRFDGRYSFLDELVHESGRLFMIVRIDDDGAWD